MAIRARWRTLWLSRRRWGWTLTSNANVPSGLSWTVCRSLEMPQRADTPTRICARPLSVVRIPTSVSWRAVRLKLSGAVPPP